MLELKWRAFDFELRSIKLLDKALFSIKTTV